MNRMFLTCTALAVLITAPALAQQTGRYPNPTDVVPTPKAPEMTQNLPPQANPNAVEASRAAMPQGSEVPAEAFQGLTVYTTRTDTRVQADKTAAIATKTTVVVDASGKMAVNATVSSPVLGESRTVTKAELKAMTDKAQNVGELNDLLISMDGRVNHAIIDVGGFLGVGERSVTVAWTDLKIIKAEDGDMVAFIDKSKADLNTIPEYKAPAKK